MHREYYGEYLKDMYEHLKRLSAANYFEDNQPQNKLLDDKITRKIMEKLQDESKEGVDLILKCVTAFQKSDDFEALQDNHDATHIMLNELNMNAEE